MGSTAYLEKLASETTQFQGNRSKLTTGLLKIITIHKIEMGDIGKPYTVIIRLIFTSD